ncbi:LysR family transcriptional regulator, partial [Klebsiella pneumoniae]|uniref:LysR family transcriptional regulator n=1 Tax=Klebsiella pneumoniae TaxID=573 RepID=UPI00227B2CA3
MREELDFKSLRFFSALYRLGNVSPAADALDISQPTGSLLLKKLRDHFADPLFVRVGQRMIPTPRADAIAPTISTLLQLADNDLAVKPEFLPQQSQRNFTIGMTDISQMTLLPLLQIALQQQAADGITFTVQNLDEQTLNALESGKCDLAIGYLTQLPESVYQQHLFDQSYVCLAAENHPRIRAQLRAEDWRQEKHLAIRVEGTAHGDMDKLLDEHHMPRRIALTLPSFLGTGELVAESDMIAVVPEQVARHITRRYPCRSWPLPFPLAKIAIRQVWHQRLHRDPGHIWLRSLIATR